MCGVLPLVVAKIKKKKKQFLVYGQKLSHSPETLTLKCLAL